MTLSPGVRLGPYEIVAPLGAGGMGEVYKARDTRLDRIVAIKVLPEILARDPEFRERFDREARAISQLTHPHICTLHDVGRSADVDYLVFEYLEGETLAARLGRGAMALEEALRVATQIAGALAAAHGAGIVHRDLKPGNVMLTRSGAKLLDFGLAKHTGKASAAGSRLAAGLTSPPTMTSPLTTHGSIVGTFQYMSPEQLEGEEADVRSDIFAFGAVLYEMVTGRKAFSGKSQASLISAILKDQPRPLSEMQPVAPASLEHTVRTCLAKDPDQRWQHAADIVRELTWIAESPNVKDEPTTRSTRRDGTAVAAALLLAALTVGLAWIAWRGAVRTDAGAARPMHLTLTLDASQPISRLDARDRNDPHPVVSVSPDGARVVYVADHGGATHLMLRELAGNTATPIPGTDGGEYPFFSPDGRWIGFWQDRKVKKIALGGGAPISLANAPNLRGAHWYANDSIVFVPDLYTGVWRVSASGGAPEQITAVDASASERTHRWPDVLPGARAIVFTVLGTETSFDDAHIVAQSLETRRRTTVIERGMSARYIPAGYLVYGRAGTLTAVPFDAATLKVTGPPTKVMDDVMTDGDGAAQFAFAPTGLFVSMPVVPDDAAVVWVDRKGNVTRAAGPPGAFAMIALAPDGHRIVLGRAVLGDLRVRDLSRGTETVLTSAARNNEFAWMPDGSRVVFVSEKGGAWNLMWKRADGTGDEEALLAPGPWRDEVDVSRDGRWLVYIEETATGRGLWLMSLPDRQTKPLPRSNGNECCPAISPDGRYVASSLGDARQAQVFIRPLPAGDQRWQVSTEGGSEPRWSADGRELFYRSRNQMMAVSIATRDGAPEIGTPRVLFEGRFVSRGTLSYSVAADGRFLMLQPLADAKPLTALDVITNWFVEVRQKVAPQP